MANYMDLYVVEIDGKRKLVRAPWNTRVKIGDTVTVSDGLAYDARIIATTDVSIQDNEAVGFYKILAGIDEHGEIPKVIKIIEEHEVNYDE